MQIYRQERAILFDVSVLTFQLLLAQMQLKQIQTFLEVCRTRHFGRAAENLNLTTSAVSSRIRLLEDSLKTPLFLRLRNSVELTEAGERLIPYFRNLLKIWEQARFSALVESDPRPNLTILAAPGLWESIDSNWIKLFVARQSEIRLRLETAYSPQILSRLEQSSADLALLMEPHAGPEVTSVTLGEIGLTLMSDKPNRMVDEVLSSDYMHVDWSTSFDSQFLGFFPDYLQADITVSTAKIAADLLVDFPGAAYLSRHLIDRLKPFVKLYPVGDAPQFRVPVYANYATRTSKAELIEKAIGCLRLA